MNYCLSNIGVVSEYIDYYLPDLLSGETYLIKLITRSKYVKTINGDKELKRILSSKEDILSNIKQLECEIPYYMGLNNNEAVLYINPNPRSYEIFMRKTLETFQRKIEKPTLPNQNQDPMTLMFNIMNSSISRKIYHDINFNDVSPYTTLDKVIDYINYDCVKTLTTKSGVHFLIELSKVNNSKYPNWLENIINMKGCMKLYSKYGDNMIPLPGSNQFGFMPEFIK